MKLFRDCWIAILRVYDVITFSSNADRFGLQLQPEAVSVYDAGKLPIFYPPTRPEDKDSSIQCDYSAMGAKWAPCSRSDKRECWLKGPDGDEYNISTEYEKAWPVGKLRRYYLVAETQSLDADGVVNKWGKVFNGSYPGPWIQACWGDDIEITIRNEIPYNGSTIHWHGLRQLGTPEMDGVNAVTQCSLAPGSTQTYRFTATQYGTSWYHSHYSLQYGDGLLGPLTIHGPSSANYTNSKDPILFTDWNHRSAFEDFQSELLGIPPKATSVLVNGLGSYAGGAKGGIKFNTTFERGKKYMLRLINTSVSTTFVFAIDSHNITVMSSDFVPIQPYVTDHVVVGIGQRYHVVVEASPKTPQTGLPDNRSEFWIRTIPAEGCFSFELGGLPDERQGIIYYNRHSDAYPTTARTFTDLTCKDEPYDKLIPVVNWTVEEPRHGAPKDFFEVGLVSPSHGHGHPLPNDTFGRWAISDKPMWLNFSDPTILNLEKLHWNPELALISDDSPEGSWIWLVITGNMTTSLIGGKQFAPVAHPLHLHGHDFALLQQSNETWDPVGQPGQFKPKFDNPPRRDVVLLPSGGFVVIAFKADNPGSWLLHCHIAWHASSGLALQILERQHKYKEMMNPERLADTKRICNEWKTWYNTTENFYNPAGGKLGFQDDSGI
ncbi:MAG: hypothetical protein M1836_002821 [Candelina mexicana]|nr:MAG: hypothetical protein M1836_002821 [Candelina mexicana]